MHSVFSTFSKGEATAVALNFAPSGGVYCDTACRLHPYSTASNKTGGCYAVRLENFRRGLAARLEARAALPPAQTCQVALHELQIRALTGPPVTWLRISSSGSVPNPDQADAAFLEALRNLFAYCEQAQIPVHFPVESAAKAEFYRQALHGISVVVRESLGYEAEALTESSGPVSYVAGTQIRSGSKKTRRRRERARQIARRRRQATGRKTIVCPAAVSSHPRAKCGICVACAKPDVDVVYPFH